MSTSDVPTCDELLERAMHEVQRKDAEIERLRELVTTTREALRDHYEAEIARIRRDYEFILELDQSTKRAETEDR